MIRVIGKIPPSRCIQEQIISFQQDDIALYPDSVLHLLENEAHFLNRDKKAVVATAVGFLKENLL